MTEFDVLTFTGAYFECALWTDELEYEMLPDELIMRMAADCHDFVKDAGWLLDGLDAEQCGHDFWLTRNGHGAGFWDRDYGKKGEQLSVLSRAYGEFEIYTNKEA